MDHGPPPRDSMDRELTGQNVMVDELMDRERRDLELPTTEMSDRDARVHEHRDHDHRALEPTGHNVPIDAMIADRRARSIQTPSRSKCSTDQCRENRVARSATRGLADRDPKRPDDPTIAAKGFVVSRLIVLAPRSQKVDDQRPKARVKAKHPERRVFESPGRKTPSPRPTPKAATDDGISSFIEERLSSIAHEPYTSRRAERVNAPVCDLWNCASAFGLSFNQD